MLPTTLAITEMQAGLLILAGIQALMLPPAVLLLATPPRAKRMDSRMRGR